MYESNIQGYYESVADHYQEGFFCADYYRRSIIAIMIDLFHLQPQHRVVDLGGGTGLTSRLLFERAQLQNNVLCVDCSQAMLERARGLVGVDTLCMTAHEFTRDPSRHYDKLLLESMIHHLSDRVTLWQQVKQQLSPDGTILIITRPHHSPLPLFKAALDSFAASQPPTDILVNELKTAGFPSKVVVHSFACQVEKSVWYQMLRNRFMSNLNDFTVREIEMGIAELEGHFAGQQTLELRDDVICIVSQR